ncbi:protein kinase fuz7 [Moesziomyces aphidis]|jgi:mitogen-activated protein kinase kinase|uniref:Mitogen-activated protein kinase kinase n=2 Tax=Moesziomyces TaxID=63261 RepID=M9M6M2_PSEA3|nr:protein kinase fuz7 [Moesziomyces aphidis]GAC76475.1 mitogen-activated protein kinase kinase [Moesziomyces antarcticus T-34]
MLSSGAGSSIRKKRNFKGLQLAESPLASPAGAASTPNNGESSAASNASTIGKSATVTPGGSLALPGRNGAEAEPNSGANYHNKLTQQLANLELGVEYKLDLKNEDLKTVSELGAGNGGTVTKVLHEKSGTVMAKKVVFIDAKPSVRKQILRELQILHECNSPYIVSFYGAYLSEPHICMCMEFMDKDSLDGIYKKHGPIPPEICGKIAVVVVHGLTYLYDVHRIIHRDVKPSNILVNGKGQIKICDFGVSGELINSIADTFVGTSTYMSPERIQGDQYSVKSDVWSLGVSVIEVALGHFPFANNDDESDSGSDSDADLERANALVQEDLGGTLSPTKPAPKLPVAAAAAAAQKQSRRKSKAAGVSLEGSSHQMSILDLLQHIVNEPPPKLPEGRFPKLMEEFVQLCLVKDPARRPTPKDLTKHAYVMEADAAKVDLQAWVDGMK